MMGYKLIRINPVDNEVVEGQYSLKMNALEALKTLLE